MAIKEKRFVVQSQAKNRSFKVANKNAKQYVDELKVFEGSNTFSLNLGEADDKYIDNSTGNGLGGILYVVYSYGHHFPMYIYDRQAGIWIGSRDKYSSSTSKHQSQCRPSAEIKCWLDTADEMNEYIRCGSMMSYMEIKAQNPVNYGT
tara:strand:- start:274 stop:717 length:444 start_codon:yes stop_codon:yes gene_type:complete